MESGNQNQQVPVQNVVVQPEPIITPPKQKSPLSKVIFILLSIVLLIIVFGVIYYIRSNNINYLSGLLNSKRLITPTTQNINSSPSLSQKTNPPQEIFNYHTTLLGTLEKPPQGKYDLATALVQTCIFSDDGFKVACLGEYTPDATQSAYAVIAKDQQSQWKAGKHYDQIMDLQYSPDSNTLAYVAQNGSNWFVVLNGKEQKNYGYVNNLVFSPDSRHIAYIASDSIVEQHDQYQVWNVTSDTFIVNDNQEGKKYTKTYADTYYNGHTDTGGQYIPIFSQDSKHLIYSASTDSEHVLVYDTKEIFNIPNSNYYPISPSQLNKDASRILIGLTDNTEKSVIKLIDSNGNVITNNSQNPYIVNNNFSLNPINNDILYVSATQSAYILQTNNLEFAQSKRNFWYPDPQFLPNGQDITYLTLTEPAGGVSFGGVSPYAHIMFNKQEIGKFPTFTSYDSQFSFSPDGQGAAIRTESKEALQNESKLYIMNKNKVCTIPYIGSGYSVYSDNNDYLYKPVFSPDGSYIGFGVQVSNQLWWKVWHIDFSNCKITPN